jgi:hypothetical protein
MMWSRILSEYIYEMHGVRVIWTPSTSDDEPPF